MVTIVRNVRLLAGLCAALLSAPIMAENIIRTPAPIVKSSSAIETKPEEPAGEWIVDTPVYSPWEVSGDFYGCTSAIPAASGLSVNVSFTQTYSGCKQDQIRTVQARVKNSLSGEIKNSGDPTSETQTIAGLSGTRTTQGTNSSGVMTYTISPGRSSGLGAGYYKQNSGGYNFGATMQKTENGYQTYFAVIYYNGLYSVQFGASTGSGINAVDNTKFDSSPFSPYVSPYNGIRLLKSDNTVLYEFSLGKTSDIRNYYIKSSSITAQQYNSVYSNISQVAKIQLFE